MSDLLRTYRRVFNIDRRIYSIEGHQLPIPGGIPLRFIGWLAVSLLLMLMLRSGAPLVMLLTIAVGGGIGRRRGGWGGAVVGVVIGWAAFTVSSFALSLLSAPIALVVIPFAIAMFSLTAQPDGRTPHRYALSFVAWQLAPSRSDGHAGVPGVGETRSFRASECYIAPDWRSPVLRAGTFTGAADLTFDRGARVRRRRQLFARRRSNRYLIRSPESRLRRSQVVARLTLEPGEQAEVRP